MNYNLNLGHAHKLKFGLFAIARSDFFFNFFYFFATFCISYSFCLPYKVGCKLYAKPRIGTLINDRYNEPFYTVFA